MLLSAVRTENSIEYTRNDGIEYDGNINEADEMMEILMKMTR